MYIKKDEPQLIPINVQEWNDEIDAFLDVRGFSVFLFNQRAMTFYNKDATPAEKFDAAFEAACLGLVDINDEPLLTEGDKEAIRAASFKPLVRMFNIYAEKILNPSETFETSKKN